MQGQISLTSFDLPNECPVQAATFRQRLLTEAKLLSAPPHAHTELASGGGDRRLGRGIRHVAIRYVP